MTAHGSSATHARSMRAIESRGGRRRTCGHCGRAPMTHTGTVRGTNHDGSACDIALTSGCEWCVRQWVRDPNWRFRR